jgi:hypothetical protein
MHTDGEPSTNEILDLLVGRPGWRLEPRSTPGTTPLWCFVFNGRIEFSVTVDGDSVRLYVMETDQEIVFEDAEGLMAWLRENRAEAMLEPEPPGKKKSRLRRITQWG